MGKSRQKKLAREATWDAFMALPSDIRECYCVFGALTYVHLPTEIMRLGYMKVLGCADGERRCGVAVGEIHNASPFVGFAEADYLIMPPGPSSYVGPGEDRQRVLGGMPVWNALTWKQRDRAIAKSWVRPQLGGILLELNVKGIKPVNPASRPAGEA